jgi:dipeptidyl aminopeptidase/acylaminoacyl peptidase
LVLPFLLQPFLFAENKVITKKFPWQIEPLAHFDLYYYGTTGHALVPYAAEYLESGFTRARKILPIVPRQKFPFLLYNNHNDFEETNVTDIGEGTGGVTEAFKNRLVVGNIGPQRYLEYVIAHETVHEFEYEYLFSGFWRSLRLLKFVFYPNWLMEGLAEYSSGDLDRTVREMYLRDAATSRRLLPLEQLYNFSHVLPHQVTLAYKESEALVRYLADEYGAGKLPQFLISFEDHFDASTVLLDNVGADLATIDRKFLEYLEDYYDLQARGMAEPQAYGVQLTSAGAYPRFYQSAVFSPDGRSIAYLSDEGGTETAFRMDLPGRTVRRLWGLDTSIAVENIHTEGNGLSFSPDGRWVAFAGEREQRDYLYLCSRDGKKLREIDTHTETVASPVFSPDGDTVFFSGIRTGFRDLYAISLTSGTLTQLTADPADQIDAAVTPDGTALVFAAERKNAAGRTEYDLCRLDLATKEQTFLTALPGDERSPGFTPDGTELYFTSDQDGVTNIYAMRSPGGQADQLTRVIGGNFQPRVAPDGQQLLFSSFRRGEQQLFLGDRGALRPVAAAVPEVAVSTPAAVTPPPAPASPARPYRFRASTDLFFPALFYSSLDGLYIATYWQASEFLGNHQLQAQIAYASGAQYFDYQLVYGFLKYRPQVYLLATGQQYYRDVEETIQRRDESKELVTAYPLNRFQSLQLMLARIDRKETVKDAPALDSVSQEDIAGLAFVHDAVRGPYLEITSGFRLQLASEFSGKVVGGDYLYQNLTSETQKYFPLGREQTLLWRTLLGGSFGPDAGRFRLGGETRVRGLPGDATYAGRRIFVNNLEWRFPVVYNINYHMWYIFPDFFFKTLYGTLFVDAGTTYNDDFELGHLTGDYWKGSVGGGLRCHTFILQMYPLLLNLQVARRLDRPDIVLYFSAGSGF